MNELGRNEEVRGISDARFASEPGIVAGTNNAIRELEPREEYIGVTDCDGEKVSLLEAPSHTFRDFEVSKLNYGYIVKVGCHKFAIESDASLIKHLTEYIKNPGEKEKKWWDSKSTQI